MPPTLAVVGRVVLYEDVTDGGRNAEARGRRWGREVRLALYKGRRQRQPTAPGPRRVARRQSSQPAVQQVPQCDTSVQRVALPPKVGHQRFPDALLKVSRTDAREVVAVVAHGRRALPRETGV